MSSEVAVVVFGHEHILRGERAARFVNILSRKYRENPELQHAGRLERAKVEQDAFYESSNTQ
jgi:hypothetical protein